jgi:hypothetical protein
MADHDNFKTDGRALDDRSRVRLNPKPKLQRAGKNAGRLWPLVWKGIVRWTGNTRIRRINSYFITPEHQAYMETHLQPGDIIIVRKNWFLSNIFLPGFWSHAVLYLGEPAKLHAYFDTEDIRAYFSTVTGSNLSLVQYLQTFYPGQWDAYANGANAEPYRVSEAICDGVIFNTMDGVAGDYAAVLRPNLSKLAKAQAIVEAFSHVGKSYDFDFNFTTDHTLVCTELVWRSYRPAKGKDGLNLPLVRIVGRTTFPANELARLYAKTRKSPQAQFDFVLFFDALEGSRTATLSSEEEFCKTYMRSKWDFALP